MTRLVKDSNLETRNGRRALKVRTKPYWRSLDTGLHIGYRRRTSGGSWIMRRLTEDKKYSEIGLGSADDFQDADGIKTLSYHQALEAARAVNDKAVRVESGYEAPSTGAYSVAEAMNEYVEQYKKEGKGLSVILNIINAHIIPSLGSTDVKKLTTKKITSWHQTLAESPARLRSSRGAKKLNTRNIDPRDPDALRSRRATANRVLTVLKAALNYAWRVERVPSDSAWRKVKPFRNVAAPVIRYLTEEECRRLVNTCPPDLKALVQGALFTGCRYSECTALRVNDYDPETKTIAIRISKSGKPRHAILTAEGKKFFDQITLNKHGSDLIFTHENGTPWLKSHQSRPLKEACQRAGIDPAISFHILRHTHGSLLAMKGVPMPVIAKQLGHADTRMTEKHYAHIAPSYVADTIRQNFPTLGIVEETNVMKMRE